MNYDEPNDKHTLISCSTETGFDHTTHSSLLVNENLHGPLYHEVLGGEAAVSMYVCCSGLQGKEVDQITAWISRNTFMVSARNIERGNWSCSILWIFLTWTCCRDLTSTLVCPILMVSNTRNFNATELQVFCIMGLCGKLLWILNAHIYKYMDSCYSIALLVAFDCVASHCVVLKDYIVLSLSSTQPVYKSIDVLSAIEC